MSLSKRKVGVALGASLFVVGAASLARYSGAFRQKSSEIKQAKTRKVSSPPETLLNKALHHVQKETGIKTKAGEVYIIGIAGGSGSGKTSIATKIASLLPGGAVIVSHDNYYKNLDHLSVEERANYNYDHPDSLDTKLLVEHVKALKRGDEVKIPTYDFVTSTRRKEVTVLKAGHRGFVLLEGILLFTDPNLTDIIDAKIFVDTPNDLRFIRRMKRDVNERGRSIDSISRQYMQFVRPMHELFVEPSKNHAHMIIPLGLNDVAVDIVLSFIKYRLHHSSRPLTQVCPDYDGVKV